jgi:hypothetical protein
MQPASNRFCSQQNSEPASRLPKTSSYVNGVKPILKKPSMSEAMLQKSLPNSSLVQQAAEFVQAQRTTIGRATPIDYPMPSTMARVLMRETTDYFTPRSTSSAQTSHQGKKKHIRFDDSVEQCTAVECNDADDDEADFNHNPWAKYQEDESSSDEVVGILKCSRRKRPLSRAASTTSISGDNKTIAKLPFKLSGT